MSLISTSTAIKCYVCGDRSELPFLEAKASNYNETFIKAKIQNSCDDFDRVPPEEKYKYELDCPEGFVGCMLNVGGKSPFWQLINRSKIIRSITKSIEKIVS